jgi:5'-nucleotidase (lipoprotein e(P4) family)
VAMQVYQAAGAMLKPAKKDRKWTAATEQTQIPHKGKKTAVILDLDETVLDNSAFNARQSRDSLKPVGAAFTPSWADWEATGKPGLVPGAKEFILRALEMEVHVVYITNRNCKAEAGDGTVKILEGHGLLPHAASAGLNKILYCDDNTRSKTKRREAVAAEYRILLLIGDDIGDMIAIPSDQRTPEQRLAFLAPYWPRFGKQWFQLPNPVYGSWERSTVTSSADPSTILDQKKRLLQVE